MAAAAPFIMLGLAGAQTVSQIKQGADQKKAAQIADAAAKKQQQALLDQQAAADAKAKANDARAQAAADMQRRRAAVGGRASTILTGAQGLTTQAPTAGKVYLGL